MQALWSEARTASAFFVDGNEVAPFRGDVTDLWLRVKHFKVATDKENAVWNGAFELPDVVAWSRPDASVIALLFWVPLPSKMISSSQPAEQDIKQHTHAVRYAHGIYPPCFTDSLFFPWTDLLGLVSVPLHCLFQLALSLGEKSKKRRRVFIVTCICERSKKERAAWTNRRERKKKGTSSWKAPREKHFWATDMLAGGLASRCRRSSVTVGSIPAACHLLLFLSSLQWFSRQPVR